MKVTIPNVKRRSEVSYTIQSQASNEKYSDLETALMDKNASGDVVLNVGASSVMESVRNIIISNFKEIPYMPKSGANITNLLFSGSIKDISLFSTSVKSQIELQDSRVKVSSLVITPSPEDHSIEFDITVAIPGDDRYRGLSDKFRIRRTANT